MPFDFADQGTRKRAIDEILSEENVQRKEESLKRFDIYQERQRDYILARLRQEFSDATVADMRTVTSINITRRMVNELATVYQTTPERTFMGASSELSEGQAEQVENLYTHSKADVKLRKANRWLELFQQCAIKVVPMNGIVDVKVLAPHHYDVIPDEIDAEKAQCYIMSVFDKQRSESRQKNNDSLSNPPSRGGKPTAQYNDNVNQSIADQDDYKRELMRFIWWTADEHFTTDGHGKLMEEPIPNPIGELPFIDVAGEKDFEFFIRNGSAITEFALDYGTVLSDISNLLRLQGYAQGVMVSEEMPKDIIVGPQHIMHLKLDPHAEKDPSFQFVSPSPDLGASLEFLDILINNFLTSRGLDTGVVTGKGQSNRYSSGVERLLAMVEKFQASKDVINEFKSVEMQLYRLLILWSNEFQNVGDKPLIPELRKAKIPGDSFVQVKFKEPDNIQTKTEREDSVIKLWEAGLLSRKEALMELRDVDEMTAEKMLEEIDDLGLEEKPVGDTEKAEDNGTED